LIENLASPHRLVGLSWSDDGESVLLRRSTVDQYPDVYLGDAKMNGLNRISDINPQQADLKWSSVDLVSWMSYDSVQLEGLVYLPEDYDTTKAYPMLVYYYELNSDNLYRYRSPRPSASIINPVECASNDYIVFVPDIRYREGYPARSAYDAVMSGTDFMVKNYAVDSLKMGLQGQSWGGYQTAQLITMTERYAAAMAGAPVSNMFSAYGGIRWGSGLNRQFQYEATQSRIGKTIWEAPELYYENSPIFHLPKVTTPLLIMHNDDDGAVPWYQGIEMYNGMRRLNKPCWMLVYNKDGHNLKKLPNKYDLSKRMGQFFDHYLKSSPMPIWMSQGIRAIDKGEKKGYGYDEE
jgi:dipeptidyl aminopeptidase/acylaminoacyl peptidase